MPRGYRNVLVALAGLALLAASPPDNRAQPKDQRTNNSAEQSLKDIAASLKEANEPVKPDAGCRPGEDNRQSDLCAQWKAADAAAESADWARLTFWLGVWGLAVGFFTLIAAGFAAWFAREAARHTESSVTEAEKSAVAAQETLAHSKEMAGQTNRPWIVFSRYEVAYHAPKMPDGSFRRQGIEACIRLTNCGTLPGVDVDVYAESRLVEVNRIPLFTRALPAPDTPMRGTIGIGNFYRGAATNFSMADVELIKAGKVHLWLYIHAKYRSPFDQERTFETEVTMMLNVVATKIHEEWGVEVEAYDGMSMGPQNRLT